MAHEAAPTPQEEARVLLNQFVGALRAYKGAIEEATKAALKQIQQEEARFMARLGADNPTFTTSDHSGEQPTQG